MLPIVIYWRFENFISYEFSYSGIPKNLLQLHHVSATLHYKNTINTYIFPVVKSILRNGITLGNVCDSVE